MSEENRSCPTCGGTLPPDAPEGTCPKCLLAAGFESADGGGAPTATPGVDEVAAEFPELEILEELGRGGMGVVYKARQRRLDRVVALKVLPREIAASAPDAARFEDRFTREARALARLSHPNIVAVHEFGERHGMYFFLMEYVDGANLRQTMRAGKLSPAEALTIVPQICDALQYAHDRGVVHRDIKPENVLLDVEGKVKIADFGLAKLVTRAADDRTLTRQGLVMGTPHYMAPEQLEKPSEVDHRADIYSLGVVIYEMLTGELPIGRFAPPSEKVQVDVKLDQVVLRSLEKEADRRYQAVSDVKTGIGDVDLSAAAAVAASASDSGDPVRPNSRSSKLAFWGLLLPLIGIALSAVVIMGAGLLRSGGMAPTWRFGMVGISVVVGGSVLLGLIFSIAGIVQIKRSEGRLHGMGLAIAGLLLPLLCCLPGVGMATLWSYSAVAPAPAVAVGVSEPTFDAAYPPEFLGGLEYEDLGEFRIEIDLESGEAFFEEQRIGLLGLGGTSADANMSTSSTPTWPPEPDTLVHLRGFQRITSATQSDAKLLFADEPIVVLPPTGGITEICDLYISASRVSEIQVAFNGQERQKVAVYGRVVRPDDPSIVVPPLSEQVRSASERPTLEAGVELVATNVSLTIDAAEGDTRQFPLPGATEAGAVVSFASDGDLSWPLPLGHELRVRKVHLDAGAAIGIGELRLPPEGVEAGEFQSHLNGEVIRAGEEGRVVIDVPAEGGKIVFEGDIVKRPTPTYSLRFVINVPEGVGGEEPAKVYPLRMLTGLDADHGPAFIELKGDIIQLPVPRGWEFRPSRVQFSGRGAMQVGRRRYPEDGLINGSFSRAYGGQSFVAGRVDDVVLEVESEAAYVELHGELVLPPEADDPR
jgi:predicted Ser/Thr protein kinase